MDGDTQGNGGRHGEADAAAVVSRSPERQTRVARHGGGLYLQVTTGKKDGQINKSWVFCYALNRRERQMRLGSLNTIGLSQAREEATDGAPS